MKIVSVLSEIKRQTEFIMSFKTQSYLGQFY